MRWPFRRRTRPDGGSRGRIVLSVAGPSPLVDATPAVFVARDLPRRDWARLAVLRPVVRPRTSMVTVRPLAVAADRSLLAPLRHRPPMPPRPVGRVTGVATPRLRPAVSTPPDHRPSPSTSVVAPTAVADMPRAGEPSAPVVDGPADAPAAATLPRPLRPDTRAVPGDVIVPAAGPAEGRPDAGSAERAPTESAPVEEAAGELPVLPPHRLVVVPATPAVPVLIRVTDEFVAEPVAPEQEFRSMSEFDRLVAQYESMPIEMLALGALGGSTAAPPPAAPPPPPPPRPPGTGEQPRRRSLAESRRRGLTAPPRATPSTPSDDADESPASGADSTAEGESAPTPVMPSVEMLRALGLEVEVEDAPDLGSPTAPEPPTAMDPAPAEPPAPAVEPEEVAAPASPVDPEDTAPDDDGARPPGRPPAPADGPSGVADRPSRSSSPRVPGAGDPSTGPHPSGPSVEAPPRSAAPPNPGPSTPPSGEPVALLRPAAVPTLATPIPRSRPAGAARVAAVPGAVPARPGVVSSPAVLVDRPPSPRTTVTRIETIRRPGTAAVAPTAPSLPRPVVAVPVDLAVALENRYGFQVHDVPVHRGRGIAELVHGVDARAGATRGHVFLPDAVGDLGSPSTRALLAHELVHVAQQRTLGGALPDEASPFGRSLEAQARAVEHWVRTMGSGTSSGPLPAPLTLDPEPGPDPARAATPAERPPRLVLRVPAVIAPSPGAEPEPSGSPTAPEVEAPPRGDDVRQPGPAPEPPSTSERAPAMTSAFSSGESWTWDVGFDAGVRGGLVGAQRAPLESTVPTVPAERGPSPEVLALSAQVEQLSAQVAALSAQLAAVNDELRTPTGLARLAGRLYRPLRTHLRGELLVDRERSGRLADIQMRNTR